MARKKLPKYRPHGSRDRGLVEWNGKRHLLPGRYDSPESREAYSRFLREIVLAKPSPVPEAAGLSIAGLVAAYLVHARKHYPPGPRGEYANCRRCVQLVLDKHGPEFARDFGPLKLQSIRDGMAKNGSLTRDYINGTINRIRRMFRWAASQELVPVAVYDALRTLQGLQRGRSQAKEPEPREPVAWEHVAAILPELPPVVAAMVQFQWHVGCRPQSVCLAAPEQFTRELSGPDAGLWLWRPRHKNEWRGRELVLPIGPQAQAIIAPFLEGKPPGDPIFSPQAARRNRRYGRSYTANTYGQAVARAINRTNEKRQKQAKERGRRLEEPDLAPHWSPHQLRHAKGHATREAYGIEGAQAILGHDSLDATEIYTARRLELAKRIAREAG